MSARIIDGKAIAGEIRRDLAREIELFKSKYGVVPTLSAVLVGEHEPSKIYIRMKENAANEVGLGFQKHVFPEIGMDGLLGLIQSLNQDEGVHGMLVQLPLPSNLDEEKVLAAVLPEKDVDGFHLINMGRLFTGNEKILPCTPLGVIRLLEKMEIPIEGKDAVIVNRSNIVGKPLAMMLLKRNATVTLCHSRTRDLKGHTERADILISATGTPGIIKEDMVKDGAVVIDIGISRVGDRLMGDVDFDRVKEKASFITPVPGGVGPMTVAMVLHNTLVAAKNKVGE